MNKLYLLLEYISPETVECILNELDWNVKARNLESDCPTMEAIETIYNIIRTSETKYKYNTI